MDFNQLNHKANQKVNRWRANIKTALRPKQKINTIYDIDLNQLKKMKISGLILDLDDTLLPKTSLDITPKLYAFIENLKAMEFKACISSNNRFPARVQFIANTLALPYLSLAYKPLPSSFKKALALLKTKKHETAVIGDQLFTDILGGNLFGLHTILVKPLTPETNGLRQMMRKLEAFCLSHV